MSNLGGVSFRDFVFGGPWWRAIDNWVNPTDEWSSMSEAQKEILIKDSVIVGVAFVIAGDANRVEDVVQRVIAEIETDESWGVWKERNGDATGTNLVAHIINGENEAKTAKNIIYDGKTNQALALARLNKANFEFASNQQIEEIITGVAPYSEKATEASSNASMLAPLITWAQQNTLLAGALGLAIVAGIFMAFNTKKTPIALSSHNGGTVSSKPTKGAKIEGVKIKQLS